MKISATIAVQINASQTITNKKWSHYLEVYIIKFPWGFNQVHMHLNPYIFLSLLIASKIELA